MIAGSSLGPEVDLAELEQRLAGLGPQACMARVPLRVGRRTKPRFRWCDACIPAHLSRRVDRRGFRGTVRGRCAPPVRVTLGIQLCAAVRVKE